MDYLFPYDIVEENGSEGMKDRDGYFVIPCIMDMIHNLESEELRLPLWGDYGYSVYLYKDDKIGFFTQSDKYIVLEYDRFIDALDPDTLYPYNVFGMPGFGHM